MNKLISNLKSKKKIHEILTLDQLQIKATAPGMKEIMLRALKVGLTLFLIVSNITFVP